MPDRRGRVPGRAAAGVGCRIGHGVGRRVGCWIGRGVGCRVQRRDGRRPRRTPGRLADRFGCRDGRRDRCRVRPVRVVPVPAQQQRQHLDGLAQTHVVGQAGAQTELLQEAQPRHPGTLIGPQRALQRRARRHRRQLARLPQPREGLPQGGAGGHLHPGPLRFGPLFLTQIRRRPGQQPHPLDERDFPVPACLLQRLPVGDGLLQLVAVHLHPLVLQQHQAIVAGEQGRQLLRRQRAVADRNLHLEVQHRGRIQPRRRRAANRDRHLGARPFPPPVRHPHRQPAALQLGNALQELIGLLRRPGRGAVHGPRIHQLPDPVTGAGSLLDRRQQLDQRGAVVGPGVLLQGAAQRHMPQPSRRTEAGGISSHERERECGIILVLRQVEAHPPHLLPLRGAGAQESGQSAARRDRLVDPLIEAGPDPLQALLRQVFPALHGRGREQPFGALGGCWRRQLEGLGVGRDVAQAGEIVLGKLLPIAHRRGTRRRGSRRGQPEQRAPPVGLKRFDGRRQRRRERLVRRRLPPQLPRRGKSNRHVVRAVMIAVVQPARRSPVAGHLDPAPVESRRRRARHSATVSMATCLGWREAARCRAY